MASFFTFYSFKGGVGRSMALANVADIFARRGLRVLAIDFDLEAPGLERYFQIEKTAALANRGLIDLLQSFKKCLAGSAPLDDSAEFRQLERFIFPVYPQPLANKGVLHLMTAGQREPAAQYAQYARSVRTFDWQDFYDHWEGQAFFEWLRSQLSQPKAPCEPYDVVLIDSRTGVTEMGGVCTYLLADAVVMLCAANHQNVEGTREVALDFRSESVSRLRKGRDLELVIVPARIEQRDDALLDKFFKRFESFFINEEPAVFSEAGLSFRELTLPYQPEFAFEEVVVSDPERREERRRIGGAFELLADALTLLARPGEALAARRDTALAAIRRVLDPETLADSTSGGAAVEGAETRFDPTLRFAGYDIFLSACETEQESAAKLAEALSREGFTVCLDPSATTPANQIAEATMLALHHSRNLLVCAGAHGVAGWQKREIEFARSSNQPIRIVPLLLPGAEQDIFSLSLRGVADLAVQDLRDWATDAPAPVPLVHALRSKAATTKEADRRPAPVDNPYVGTEAYDESRVRLIDTPTGLLDTLGAHLRKTGLCHLSGATGVGKGSLVAALVARLRQTGLVADQPLRLLRLHIDQPDLAERLAAPEPGQLVIIEHWDRLPAALAPPAGAALWPEALRARINAATPDHPVLLVGSDLPLAAWRRGAEASLFQRLAEVTCTLPPPDSAEVRKAIETPASRSGFAFEPGLLDRIVQDTGSGPGALALAQMILVRLWGKAVRGFLTNAAYDACGGIAAIFATHVEERLVHVPEGLQAAVDALMLRLAVAEDDGRTRWQDVAWEVVRSQPVLAARGAEALLWMMGARLVNVWRASPDELRISLLLPSADPGDGRLAALVDTHRDELRLRRRLDAALAIWKLRGERADALASGYRLGDALRLQRTWAEHLNTDETAYIERSRQRARLTRLTLAGIGAGLFATAAIGWLLNWQRSSIYDAVSLEQKTTDQQIADAAAAIVGQKPGGSASSDTFRIDAALFSGVRIYPHYKAADDRATVATLALLLRAQGVKMELAELKADTATCGEVRYFRDDDRTRARALAAAITRLLHSLGYDFELDTLQLGGDLARGASGQLEVWLPPLRSLVPVAHRPAPNLADGAELRTVPGSCTMLGSLAADRQALARQIGTPYLALFDNDLPLRRQVWLDGFQMYRYEVTREQFARFAADCRAGRDSGCPGVWPPPGKPAGPGREPARFLSWVQADAYCRWAGGRLPSEDEWEKAARGTDGRIWPWGNLPDATRFQGAVTSERKRIAEVGSFSAGDSPYGIADLAGNVWELTASSWSDGLHVMKGGSYLNTPMEVRASMRWASSLEASGADYLGFRCVKDLARPSDPSSPK